MAVASSVSSSAFDCLQMTCYVSSESLTSVWFFPLTLAMADWESGGPGELSRRFLWFW